MASLQDVFNLNESGYRDQRTRINILPDAIIKTSGKVTGTECLFEDRPTQPFLGNLSVCSLKNEEKKEHAMVLLDFGRELHGTLKLTVNEVRSDSARAEVRIRLGESVMEALAPIGHKNATNDHAVRDHVYDIGQYSNTETSESGFRFACIELISDNTEALIQSVEACMVFRDIPYIGSFECSDPLLEEIWKTAAYTVHLNMQNYLWDGIKRDRLAWQGDMHTEVMSIENVFGANPVVPETLDFLRDGTPSDEWINGYSSYSLWWILVQAEWYRYTGDLEYLKEQKKFLHDQISLAIDHISSDGEEEFPEFRFLDWKNRDNEKATHAGLQALMVMALDEAAQLLELLGDSETASVCRDTREKMKVHVPDHDMSKQAAALLVLSGLGDAETINRDVIAPGGAADYSTFMGYYLLAAKAEAGDITGALDDMRSYWGGMLKMGATSFWEDFDLTWMDNAARIDEIVQEGKMDIHGDFGGYCYMNYRHSLCHGWASGPVPFISRHILGVKIAEPGCRKLIIEPHLGDLKYARGTVPTPYGEVMVSHTANEDGTVSTEYSAPEGIEIILADHSSEDTSAIL